MSIVTQINLFSEEENLGELEKNSTNTISITSRKVIKKLKEHQEELTEMMVILERKLQEELPDFGKEVAIDGKMIQSYAN